MAQCGALLLLINGGRAVGSTVMLPVAPRTPAPRRPGHTSHMVPPAARARGGAAPPGRAWRGVGLARGARARPICAAAHADARSSWLALNLSQVAESREARSRNS